MRVTKSAASEPLRREMTAAMQLAHDIGETVSMNALDLGPKPTVSEVYSPPRVTEAVRQQPQSGLAAGFALDLTTGWDFDIAERRRAARDLVEKEQPALLIDFKEACTTNLTA